MLRIVFLGGHLTQSLSNKRDCRFSLRSKRLPKRAPYPKPFKQTLRVRLAFLTLIRSIKQACLYNFCEGVVDCRLRFTSPTSSVEENGTVGCVSLRRLPRWAPYPKPFKQTLRVRLAFLLLVCLRKQAFDTASKQKSLSLCDRLCRAYGNRTRITRMKT